MINVLKQITEEIDNDIIIVKDELFKNLDGTTLNLLKKASEYSCMNKFQNPATKKFIHFINYNDVDKITSNKETVLLLNPFSYSDYRIFSKFKQYKNIYVLNFDHEQYLGTYYNASKDINQLSFEFKFFIEKAKGFLHKSFYDSSDFIKHVTIFHLPFVFFKVNKFYDVDRLDRYKLNCQPSQLSSHSLIEIVSHNNELQFFPRMFLVETDLESYVFDLLNENKIYEINYLWYHSNFKTFISYQLLKKLFFLYDIKVSKQNYIFSIDIKINF